MIPLELFVGVFPHARDPEQWVALFQEILPDYQIDTPRRLSAFFSQCGYESAGWTRMEENLNYSAGRLAEVFPRYFPTIEIAHQYHRQPQRIANRVYANRMGNGPESSGDGWRFRGRGPIQLTGRYNYEQFAQSTFDNWEELVDTPDAVAKDKEVGLLSACWFWEINNLNSLADVEDIPRLTQRINGGHNGLGERIELYDEIYKIFQ